MTVRKAATAAGRAVPRRLTCVSLYCPPPLYCRPPISSLTVATTAEVELEAPDSILTAGSISRSPINRRLAGGSSGAAAAAMVAVASVVGSCWLGGWGGQVGS